jgi:polysaccharide biosynthesis transport protein
MERGEVLMAEPEAEPTVRAYLLVLRKRRWWVAALTILGLAVSLALSLTQQKQYSASAQLLVQATGGINLALGSAQYYSVTPTDVQTELQLVTSAQVQNLVKKELGSTPPVSAAEVGQTNVIAVTAVNPNPARAALIANTYAKAFVSSSTAATISNLTAAETQLGGQIQALDKEISQLKPSSTAQLSALYNQQAVLKGQLAQLQVAGTAASTGLEFVTPALAPTSPSSPKPAQDAVLGLLAGLGLGVGAAFLRDSLDDTLTTSETVEQVNGAPVLGTVPMVASWKKIENPVMVAVSDPTSPAAEAYRSLRTSLQFSRQDGDLRTLLITSSHAREGKTATVANLGAVFAQAGERVVLVSCDLRRPRLSQSSAPANAPELSSVLAGESSLDQALTPVADVEGLWSLSTRSTVANPTEMLSSRYALDLFTELAERFDLVIIDSPPVLPVADAMILTSYADAVLLVVASGQTRRAELQRTTEKLTQASTPIVGMLLNKVNASSGYGRHRGYGGYGSYYSSSVRVPGWNGPNGPNGPSTHNGRPPLSSGTSDRHER